MSKKKKSNEYLLFKATNNFVLIKETSLINLTFKSILKLAENSNLELKRQLMLDALGKAEFIEKSKVVEELEKSLSKITKLNPILIQYLNFNIKSGELN